MNQEIRASIFRLPEPGQKTSARDLWITMATDVSQEFPESYAFNQELSFKILELAGKVVSPDGNIVRFRTIEVSIRRRSGCPTLLDLSVGNHFAEAREKTKKAIHIVTHPKYSNWARSYGKISLSEHLGLIKAFVSDLLFAGWHVEPDQLGPVSLPHPLIRTSRGIGPYPVAKLSSVSRTPICYPKGCMDIFVVSSSATTAHKVASQLCHAFKGLLGSDQAYRPNIRIGSQIDSSCTNLVLLTDDEDLNLNPLKREQLRAAEARGMRFKLSRVSSLAKQYPCLNIAFDLFHLAGARLWTPSTAMRAFCCVDAGHDKESNRSRWVRVESDSQQNVSKVSVYDSGLGEHLSARLVERLWPQDPEAILCRDGRLSQERGIVETRLIKENRALIEVIKSPRSILWHGGTSSPESAHFGDAIVDSHGEILVQTVTQNISDYIRPVRLSTQGGDPIDLASHFIHQQTMPGLSFFNLSRLPGSLYFADLVSKLTADGWPKAIGRGFAVPTIIPPS